jgi:hypothetical protein
LVRELQDEFPNLRLLASTDPTTTEEEYESLVVEGWSTMFYGDPSGPAVPSGQKVFACPKTFKKLKEHCAICKGGCFSAKQVHVHLKQH